jgi:capsid protein
MSRKNHTSRLPKQTSPAPDTTAPQAWNSGIAASDNSPDHGYIWFPNLTGQHQFAQLTRREARRRSQWAAWNVPPARKATRDLARWVGAVTMRPATEDQAFNSAVQEWWTNTYERRPGAYDASGKFTASEFLVNAMFAVFRDGDMLAVHATDDSGAPIVIAVESALVDNPGTDTAGEWFDGVRLGPNYRPIAYNIRREVGTRSRDAIDIPIPAGVAHLFANYETHSATRGTPALVHAISQIMDYREIDNDLRKILKVHGLFGLVVEREAGAVQAAIDPMSGRKRVDNLASVGSAAVTGSTTGPVIPRTVNEVIDRGEIANLPPGHTIKPLTDGREFPSQAAVKNDIYAQIAMGLGVPVELLFMLDKLTGPGVRFVLRQAQEWRNTWLDKQVCFLTTDYLRRVEWAMRTRQVPRCRDPKWWRHVVNYPRSVTIDEGRDANAQRSRLATGLTNWATEYGEQGETWQDQVRQRIAEIALVRDECAAVGIDPALILGSAAEPPAPTVAA